MALTTVRTLNKSTEEGETLTFPDGHRGKLRALAIRLFHEHFLKIPTTCQIAGARAGVQILKKSLPSKGNVQ